MRTIHLCFILLPSLLIACDEPALVLSDPDAGGADAAPPADLGASTPDLAAAPDLAPPADPTRVRLPAGKLLAGSAAGDADEQPVHEVAVTAFALDRAEVTVSAYRRCVTAGACSAPAPYQADVGLQRFCNWGRAGLDDHPVNCIDWTQAAAYCAFAGGRLPSEAEWEYAARGGSSAAYPWGGAAPGKRACWNRWEAGTGTCAVGAYAATLLGAEQAEGLRDLAGNVWEWTQSPYCKYTSTGSEACAASARVIRGGSWSSDEATLLRAANRRRLEPAERYDNVGVRCAY